MNSRLLPVVLLLFGATLACSLGSTTTPVPPTPAIAVTTAVPAVPPSVVGPTALPVATVTPAATAPPTSSTAIPQPTTVAPLAPPTIISFTADKTTVVEWEDVTLSWQATGGTEVFISWVGKNCLLAGPTDPLDPNGGTVVINPDGEGDIVLTVRNSAGETEAHVYLTIECAYEWVPALADDPPFGIACPWEAETGPAAQQQFENGFMIWLGPSRAIYVFYGQPDPSRPNPRFMTVRR